MLNKNKGGNMDTFSNYGSMEVLQVPDQELDNRLKECKTDDEKDKVIKEYISMRLFALGAAILILFVAAVIVGVIIYILK